MYTYLSCSRSSLANADMKFRNLKIAYLFFFAALLSGCRTAYDYVKITGGAEYGPEKAFVESLFEDDQKFKAMKLKLLPDTAGLSSIEPAPEPALYIEFLSSWESEAAYGDIVVSRKFLVPQEDPLNGRIDTTLASCLAGKEKLVPVESIAPPFTALRVDGLALGDKGYPLVWTVGLRVVREPGGREFAKNEEPAQGKAGSKKLEKKLRALEKVLAGAPKPLLGNMPEIFWITAGGDTMLERGATEILFEEGPSGIFGGTAEMLASSDLALINLEGVISDRGEKVKKSFNFRFVPEIAAALKDAGIDAVLHANNHVYDYGGDAFLDSLSWLSKAGIGIAGAGGDDDAAAAPFVFSNLLSKGNILCLVFGIASFPREQNGWDGVSAAAAPGVAGMLHAGKGGREKIKAIMEDVKANASPDENALNIILFHGGVEWSIRPDAATRELYTDLIDAGADLVIGTHPHTVQGFEWVKGKPVFWSLGNYVFGGMGNTNGGEEGLFIRLGYMQGRLVYLEPYPLKLTHTRTDIAPREKLNVFYARSRELRTSK